MRKKLNKNNKNNKRIIEMENLEWKVKDRNLVRRVVKNSVFFSNGEPHWWWAHFICKYKF